MYADSDFLVSMDLKSRTEHCFAHLPVGFEVDALSFEQNHNALTLAMHNRSDSIINTREGERHVICWLEHDP